MCILHRSFRYNPLPINDIMSLKEDMKLLDERKYYTVGELHILRSEEDLQVALVNAMQSIQILIYYIRKTKSKYENPKKQDLKFISPLEVVLSKLLKQINIIFDKLKADKENFCVPGVSVIIEAIAIMLTKIVINFMELLNKYKEDYAILIIGQVMY